MRIGYNSLEMKVSPKFYPIAALLAAAFLPFSCVGAPEPGNAEIPAAIAPATTTTTSTTTTVAPAPEAEAPVVAEPEEQPFDPASITPEVFDATKTDIQQLIGKLNDIIRAKDFDSWTTYLSPEYRAALSDPEFLAKVSDNPVLKRQGVVLRELKDYFIYVVVPSRAWARLDDIEFIGQHRVIAYTVNKATGERLRLYNLENVDGSWKIVN